MPRAADERSRDGDHRQHLQVGAFRIDAGALQVASGGQTTRLKPKAMGVLLALARSPGVTLSRDELLDEVWGSAHVTPGVVAHAVTALRRAFGDSVEQPTYIETIPRIGYRLVAAVQVLAPGESTDAHATGAEPILMARAVDPGHEVVAPASTGVEAVPAPTPTAAIRDPGPPGEGQRTVADPPPVPAAPAKAKARRPSPLALTVLALATLLTTVAMVLAAVAWRSAAGGAAPSSAAGITAGEARRITFGPGAEAHPRLNPGGDWLVYTRRDRLDDPPRLFLQSLHGTEPIPLAGGGHAERPAWSPDGREVAYVWRPADGSRCEIRVTGIDGGGGQTLVTCPPRSVVYLDWNPVDANQIAWSAVVPGSSAGTRLSMLRRTQGWAPEPFDYEHLHASTDLYPRFSPDGRRIAFRGGSNPTSDLYSVASSGGPVTRLTSLRSEINGFDWLPDGSGLVFSSSHEARRALYALDIASGSVTALDIVDASSPDVAARGGAIAYQLEAWRSSLLEYPLDGGPARVLAPSSGRDFFLAMAADDSRLVFSSDRDGSSQLWLLERSNNQAKRLTRHEAGVVESPVLSADGRRVLYILRIQGRHELHEYDLDRGLGTRVAVARGSLRNAIYAGDDRSLWYAAWQGDGWRLHACVRSNAASSCEGKATRLQAFRVERARIDGRSALLLTAGSDQSLVEVVGEDDLAPLDVPPLLLEEPWLVVGDAVWSLRFQPGEIGIATLQAHSLRDGMVTPRATLPAMRHLLGSGFQVSADRRRLVLPVVTENRTDIGVASLQPNGS